MNINELINEIEKLPLEEKVDTINELKLQLKKISPFAVEPVDCVQWVKEELVIANDYNPNSVAPLRICQPYGDDQRRGLWLFHLIEPDTWAKVVARVNGANSGALYINETGNINGYNKVKKPAGHTWKSFASLLLNSMPPITQEHYKNKFYKFIKWWEAHDYPDGIPDEADPMMESKKNVPSYRRICKCLLRNDYWCKGLSFTQQKSTAYEAYCRKMKEKRGDEEVI